MFIKKQAFKCFFKIILWREIDNATIYFLIFLMKIYIGNSISIRKVIIKEGKRQRRGLGVKGSLMNNLWLISHGWYDVEKLTIPSSSDLNLIFSWTQQNVCVKKMKEKCVIFFIINLNAKVSLKPSGRVTFLRKS